MKEKNIKSVAIIGSGVVGTATGKGMIAKGFKVVFYDVRKETINSLEKKGLDARHADGLDVEESDVFFLTVSTPTEKGKINLKHIKEAAKNLGKKLKKRKDYFLVSVRSTVLPGTTEEIVVPIIEKESGKKAGRDFGVAMNPEYLREEKAEEDFHNPWIIVIGCLDERSKKIMAQIYKGFNCPIHFLSILEAEKQKYVHNLFNAVKISFFNEMRMVSDLLGINPDKIFEITADSAEGSWNKKYGIRDFGPFDGMCLPKDTQAFSSWSKKLKIKLHVLEGAISSNKKFQEYWNKNKKRR